MCYDPAECDRECEMEGGVIALPVSVPLPWQPPRSWASPGDPTASSSSPGSRCYRILPLLPSRAWSLPPAAAPHSSAPSSGGSGPGSRTPSRSHQSPSSPTPGRRRERTSPPSCAACRCGKSLGSRWKPPGVGRKRIRFHSDCNHRRSPSGTHGCCSLWAFPDGSGAADPRSSTKPRGLDPRRWGGPCGSGPWCGWCRWAPEEEKDRFEHLRAWALPDQASQPWWWKTMGKKTNLWNYVGSSLRKSFHGWKETEIPNDWHMTKWDILEHNSTYWHKHINTKENILKK